VKTDAELVRLCLQGDTDAYGDLVDRYQGAVYATAYYYVGRYGAAEDIAQDAFLAAYRSLPKLKDPDRFGPWLREVSSRTAANWLRKHGKRLENETPLPYRRRIDIEDAREGPERMLQRSEQIDTIHKAIEQLPDEYKLIVVLRYLQELSYDEIVQFTGHTLSEVRGKLQRASDKLRTLLADMKAAEEDRPNWRRARK
jgi:RNA polymerase sigma-70 factor (ECF subfamily)